MRPHQSVCGRPCSDLLPAGSALATPRRHSLGATGVKDYDLGRNPVRLGKKGFTLPWKKQAIEVGGEVAVDGVGPDG